MSSSEATSDEYQLLPQSRPDPSAISAKIMAVAEKITWKEVLFRIHPTLDEHEKRADIILFLQEIVTQSFDGIQVMTLFSINTFLTRCFRVCFNTLQKTGRI